MILKWFKVNFKWNIKELNVKCYELRNVKSEMKYYIKLENEKLNGIGQMKYYFVSYTPMFII